MTTITDQVPTIQPEHVVGHSEDDTQNRKLPQSIRLPDLYQKVKRSPHPPVTVRYRIHMDTSYLNQSYAIAELWCSGQGWQELCSLKVSREFYIISGPDQKATDPRSRELTRAFDSKKADYIAKSWQKVLNLLAEEAETVLKAIG